MHAIDLREGVIWAARLLLDREPTESDVAQLVAGCSIETLRRVFTESAEYKSWLAAERANRIPPAADVDRREGLKWAFRLLLGRELDDATADLMKDGVKTVSDIRDTVIFRNEFRLRAEPELVIRSPTRPSAGSRHLPPSRLPLEAFVTLSGRRPAAAFCDPNTWHSPERSNIRRWRPTLPCCTARRSGSPRFVRH